MNIPASSSQRSGSSYYAAPIGHHNTVPPVVTPVVIPRFHHRNVSHVSTVTALKYTSGAIVCGAILGAAVGAAEVVAFGGRDLAGSGAAAGAAAGTTFMLLAATAVTCFKLGVLARARNNSAIIAGSSVTESSIRNNTSALSGRVPGAQPTAPPAADHQAGRTCVCFENHRGTRTKVAKLGYAAMGALAGAAVGAAIIGATSCVAATLITTKESDTVIYAAKMGGAIGGVLGAIAGSVGGVIMFDGKHRHGTNQTASNAASRI